ncbi:MAG TPA: hypothetical protein VMS76_07125 [Planctomycetota bacterium]|nr:hypothetical protein [Planctomycetota bacterium]
MTLELDQLERPAVARREGIEGAGVVLEEDQPGAVQLLAVFAGHEPELGSRAGIDRLVHAIGQCLQRPAGRAHLRAAQRVAGDRPHPRAEARVVAALEGVAVAEHVHERVLEQVERVDARALLGGEPAQPSEHPAARVAVEQLEVLAGSAGLEEDHQLGVEPVVEGLGRLGGVRIGLGAALGEAAADGFGQSRAYFRAGEECRIHGRPPCTRCAAAPVDRVTQP